MAESNSSPVNSGSIRKQIRDAHEAALSAAFEEVHRLLDRVDDLKNSMPQLGTGSAEPLAAEVTRAQTVLVQLGERAKQDIEATAKRESINVAESVREGARQAALDGYLAVEKKAITQINEAVASLNDTRDALQTACDALKNAAKSADKPASGVSLPALLASLSVFAVILLGGFWYIHKAPAIDPSVAFYSSLPPAAQTQIWRVLPADVQATISRYYQPKQ